MVKKSTKSDVKKRTKKSKDAPPKVDDRIAELEESLRDAQNQVLELTKDKDQLVSDVDDFKEQSLRAMAELENVKRRKEQEKRDAIKFGNERLVSDLLPVLDAFQLAMGQSDVSENEAVQAVLTGFEMIQKQLVQFLEKQGVQKIESLDQVFDPELHQAISQEPHEDKDPNTVVKEMQAGYKLNDRVIRPSMVVVSTK